MRKNLRKADLVCVSALFALTAGCTSSVKSPAEASRPAGEVRSDNGMRMKLCWCPAGKFTMGSPKSETDRGYDEDQVEVTLTHGVWLGKTEVTQGQWTQIMKAEPWKGETYAREG